MFYTKNDMVELVNDVAPFRKGDVVRILDVNEENDTYDICGPNSMEIWVKNVSADNMKGEYADELV